MGDYLNLEDPGKEMQDTRHSSLVEMTNPVDETEDMEVFEIHEAPVMDAPLPVATVDKPVTKTSLVETTVSEITPATEAVVIEHVTSTESVSLETP